MSGVADPRTVTEALEAAQDAFEYRDDDAGVFEQDVSSGSHWRTQLSKACRYLVAVGHLTEADGFYGAVIELCFSAMERTLEGYLLQTGDEQIEAFRNHRRVYARSAELGVFTRETATALEGLYRENRTRHYYGTALPTRGKAASLVSLARAVHEFVTGLFDAEDVCRCDQPV